MSQTSVKIRILYIFTKYSGLLPLQLQSKQPYAIPSKSAASYCIICTIIASCILFYSKLEDFHNLLIRDQDHQTIIIVNGIKILSSYLRTICLYVSQLIHRKQFINIINEGCRIRHHIDELCDKAENTQFLDKKCSYFVTIKAITLICQILIIMVATFLQPLYTGHGIARTMIIYAMGTYLSDGLAMIVSSIFCFGMVVALQFYRHLNKRLSCLMSKIRKASWDDKMKMKMQFYCDSSDQLDRIANVYDQISKYTCQMNGFMSMAMLLTILNAFVYTLSGVSVSRFLTTFRFYFLSINSILVIFFVLRRNQTSQWQSK